MLESRAVFERNLAAIRKRSPRLAKQLEEASTEGVEVETGPRGARVLKQAGVRLGSAYDPVREGEQMAGSMAAEPADLMVAIGFGMGAQFAPYLELNPATLIIFEPSIERLRAALEHISIANLMATHRDLYLTTDLEAFSALFSARYVSGLRIRVFPHPAVLRLDRAAVAEVVERTQRLKSAVDSRIATSIEMLMPWAWITAGNGERLARTPNLSGLEGAFRGKPAVIVAAGPSLDKQLPRLREVQDQVVIIAIGQTVGALRAAGIEPHLVHIVESKDVSHQLTDAGDTTSLCTAYTPDCHPAVFDVPTRARFAAIAGASPMGVWIARATGEGNGGFTMGGGTVAQGAVGIAVVLGCQPIALIGQDLAFTDGRVYASHSAYDFVSVDLNDPKSCHFNNVRRKVELLKGGEVETRPDRSRDLSVVWVESWSGGEKVPTWAGYASFIEQYRELGYTLASEGIHLVNCTEGGARIPGIEHRPFDDFLESVVGEVLDPRSIFLEAYDAFTPHSLDDYRSALAEARQKLSRVEEENAEGLRFSKKLRKDLPRARSDQQRLDLLRGLARYEKRVRRQLEQIAWLDALVQPEIYKAMAAFRRTERQDPTDEDLAQESGFLFEAAKNGVIRAREWFDAFEASFEDSGEPIAKPVPNRAGEREAAPRAELSSPPA